MVHTLIRLVPAALVAAGLAATPAQAVVPGANGKIAFHTQRDGNFEVYAMDPSGSAQTNLTQTAGQDSDPAWSPDGRRIAFVSNRGGTPEIFVMKADGSGQTPVTTNVTSAADPAWSPDGQRIVFYSNRDGNFEVYVVNVDGSGLTNLTNNSATDFEPDWSPDGQRIAFASDRDGNFEIYTMNANGSGLTNVTNAGTFEQDPAWSPDGQRIAFLSNREGSAVFVMAANGSDPTKLTDTLGTNRWPAWSPDGQKITFVSTRDGDFFEVWAMNADGAGQTRLTTTEGNLHPDWQRVPTAQAGTCGDTVLQLNRATVEGNLEETASGSGIFRAGPGEKVFVGGFELLPRIGGELLVDTNTNTLSEGGEGVSVFFGIFPVPLDVDLLPTNLPEATIPLNRDGTLLKALFSLPISGQVKAAWAEDGKATNLEFELEGEKLVGDFGSFQGAGVEKPSLKATASQKNCTGFDFTGAEVKADEISFIPTKLKVPKKLGLKNILFKYEENDGVSFWTGQGELILPTGSGSLAVGGKVTIAGTKLGGVGLSTSGINRPIGYGVFLQSVAGELAFEPDFGFDFGVGATLGPEVQGKKLVKLTGNLRGFALAEGDCKNGKDPISLVATGSIPLVEELNAGAVKIEGVNCIYTDSLAMEQSPKIEAVFGEVVNGEVPNPAVAAKANLSGFVGADGINAEGGGSISIPVIGDVAGQALISTRAFAACGGVGFFSGGAAHVWGQNRTDAFTGCDLSQWRVTAGASVFSRGLAGPLAFDAAGGTARTAATVTVGANVPFTGFSARGKKGAPRVRVTGPKGESFTSRNGRAVVQRNVVMIPFEPERRTFVFIKSPSAGRWQVEAVDGAKLTEVRTAKGLPKPKVLGEVTGTGTTRTLSYAVERIPGQKVTFLERTDDGVAQTIGTATGATGRLAFAPASTGQPARIEAFVEQDGFPRDTIVVTGFTATAPAKAKPPARPRKVRAKRARRGLAVSWKAVRRAARYRVDVLKGRRRVARRTVSATRLQLKRVPAARLRVEVRAASPSGALSPPGRTTLTARR
jgi:Tol biopolymer transport system component